MGIMTLKFTHQGLLLAAMILSQQGLAQTLSQVYGSELDRQTMTASLQGDVGMMAVESDTAGSKESAQMQTVTAGIFAGEGRKLGLTFRSSENRIPFALNRATMTTNWRDIKLQGRLGSFYPNVAASVSEIAVDQNEAEFVDIYGTSIGAGFGVFVPLWGRAVAFFDGTNYITPNATDRQGHDVEVGPRLEADAGASIDITERMLDLMMGYRYRSFSLKVDDGETNREVQQGAYIGVRTGVYF